MKLSWMLAAVAAMAILTGCDSTAPSLLSVEPATTEKDAAIDPALLGGWEEPGNKDLTAIVRQGDHGGYQIVLVSGGTVVNFQATLFFIGEAEFLDLAPGDDNDFRLPGHAIMRVWTSGGSLRWAFLDSDWLKKQAAGLAVHTSDGKMQIFSAGAAVRSFLAANGANDQAYGKSATWQRIQ